MCSVPPYVFDVRQSLLDAAQLAVVLRQEAQNPLATAHQSDSVSEARDGKNRERCCALLTTTTVGASHSDDSGKVLEARRDARKPSNTFSMMAT